MPKQTPGVPPDGFRTVRDILPTNPLRFRAQDDAAAVGIELVSAHATGAPVVDDNGKLLGFISESDLLKALEAGADLHQHRAAGLMSQPPIAVAADASIREALALINQRGIRVLPIVQDGTVVSSVTRHDLLRALIGLGPAVED